MSFEMCYLLLALKKLLENAYIFVTDVVLNILPCSADFTCMDGPTLLEVYRELQFKSKVTAFRINFFKNDLSVSKHSRKATAQASVRLRLIIAFNFVCEGPSLSAIVDILVLDIFNSNNLLSEAVVGLKLFYPKSFRKQFSAFLKAANFT